MKLTLPQQDIYFEQLIHPNEPIYNIGAKISITGAIDQNVFESAYTRLIQDHDSFRSIIKIQNDEVRVSILDSYSACLGFINFSLEKNPDQRANSYMQEEFKRPFDLQNGKPLFSFTLIKLAEDSYYLFSFYHHIITDGWGTSLMFQRLVQNYNEIINNGKVITCYPFTYLDFIKEDMLYRNSMEFTVDSQYWKDKFSTLPEILFEKINNNLSSCRSSRKELVIDRNQYNKIVQFANNLNCGTFHFILAALFSYFGNKNDINDLVIGLPVLNRPNAKFKKTVGLFMGITPLRVNFSMEDTVEMLMNKIKGQLKQDYRHQKFPLGQIVNELNLYNKKDCLFNIVLSYEKQDYSSHFIGTQTIVSPLSNQSERAALTIYIREFDSSEDIKIDFDYNHNYFTEYSISELVTHFNNILFDILSDKSKKIQKLSYLSYYEKDKLLNEFCKSKITVPVTKTVVELFEEVVLKMPNKIALSDSIMNLTYYEVNQLSDKIAHFILENYAGLRSPIGVKMNRSPELIYLLLGIFKAGKNYVPLDPNLPKKRVDYIVTDSKLELIIGEKGNLDSHINYIKVEDIIKYMPRFIYKPQHVNLSDIAYVIYTSGTTGKPKGVEITHKSLSNFLASMVVTPGIDRDDIFYSVTTYSFDISILEFFGPLISGATTFVAGNDILTESQKIINDLKQVKPSIIQATPSFYQMLFDSGWKGEVNLKILCGGDLLSGALAGNLLDSCKEVWNMYGPTETTIWSSIKRISHYNHSANIGKPIYNTCFYILNSKLSLLPIGTIGRIFIGGDGLAKGYYGDVEQTDQKFISNPYDVEQKIYDTGDLGKWNENGEIEFLGRHDFQVKLRGYRIEPVEIENHINDYLEINNSVVMAKKTDDYDDSLIAYIPKVKQLSRISDLKAYLQNMLPIYMVPEIIIELESFPYTANHKVDRKELILRASQYYLDDSFKNAETNTEIKLLEIWQEVLKIDSQIGTNQNFFSLGGHSLLAAKVVYKIQTVFEKDISMKNLFENPTIDSLASFIDKQDTYIRGEAEQLNTAIPFILTPAQLNIWLTIQNTKLASLYNMFSVFEITGSINRHNLQIIFNDLIDQHETLRTNFVILESMPHQKVNLKKEKDFFIETLVVNEVDLPDIVSQFSNHIFNLESDFLIKLIIVKTEVREVILFLTHHIVLDGFSLGLLIKQASKLYVNLSDDLDLPLPASKYFSQGTNRFKERSLGESEIFWNDYLLNFKKPTIHYSLLSKYKGVDIKGKRLLFDMDSILFNRLKDFTKENRTTLYTLLISTFKLFLSIDLKQHDICIGTVVSGRNILSQSNLGMYAKTLPLRSKIDIENTCIEFLKITEQNIYEIETNQELPSHINLSLLFDIMFVYQHSEFSMYDPINFGEVSLKIIPQENLMPRLPLAFIFNECKDKIILEIEFDMHYYNDKIINSMWNDYKQILSHLISQPLDSIKELRTNHEQYKLKNNIRIDFNF